jgi:ubiquinol-cytochrome c reductase cytochrome b subunit
MGVIGQIGQWFDQRLQLAAPIREVAEHPVPRNTASWFYVFGSAALTVFVLQLVTGILLALIYVPSASEAWSSLQALNHDVTLGWFIRAMHGWGSSSSTWCRSSSSERTNFRESSPGSSVFFSY